MEPLARLRQLRRRRGVLLAVGAVAALALGFVLASKPSSSALALTRVVLDTPTSQVIEDAPFGADTLPQRASLLAHLMASKPIRRQLAGQLEVPADQLAVVDPALSTPQVPASLPEAAAEAVALAGSPYVLTTYLSDESLPIITVRAQGPDAERAAQLAVAAVGALRAQAPRPKEAPDVSFAEAEFEAAQTVPRALQGFVVDEVSPVRVKAIDNGPDPIKVVGLSMLAFGLWCACVTLGPGLARGAAVMRSRLQRGAKASGRSGIRDPLGG